MFLFVDEGVSALRGSVPGFSAFEAEVVVKTPLAFFGCEFFNADGINIHGIGVSLFLGVVVVVPVVLEGEEWVGSSFYNLIGFFPDMFEVECL